MSTHQRHVRLSGGGTQHQIYKSTWNNNNKVRKMAATGNYYPCPHTGGAVYLVCLGYYPVAIISGVSDMLYIINAFEIAVPGITGLIVYSKLHIPTMIQIFIVCIHHLVHTCTFLLVHYTITHNTHGTY